MKKRIPLKAIACMLCMLLTLQTGFFHTKASADERTISMYYDGFTWKSDYTFTNPVNGKVMTFRTGEEITRLWFRTLNTPAYCVEPGASIDYGTLYSSGDTAYWNRIKRDTRYGINLALLYGYPNTSISEYPKLSIAITQIVVWEYVLGYRDPYTGVCSNRSLINNLSVPSEYQSSYMDVYKQLDESLVQALQIPSFISYRPETAPTYTLKYNADAGDYETILHDTNDITTIGQTSFSADGVTFTALDSRTLKVSTKRIIDETAPVNVDCAKNIPKHSDTGAIAIWSASAAQSILTGSNPPDPISAFMRLQTESAGNLTIRKHSEDGIVSGIAFIVTGNGLNRKGTTNSEGLFKIPLLPVGLYTIQEDNIARQYNYLSSHTVSILPGQTTTVDFNNTLKKGRVKFVKKDSYSGGYLSGAVYRIYKADGTYAAEVISDASQWIYSPNLTYGDYFIQEVHSPTGFALDSSKHPFSVTESDQVIPLTLEDLPLSDVYPTFVKPNATYRSGTEVIASYLIHNNSYAEHASDRPLTVHFTASCFINGATKNVTTQQNNVVVPRSNENLTWFKVKIPTGTSQVSFTCTIDIPSGVVETNTENNTDKQVAAVSSPDESQTPNTKFENTPTYFNRPNDDTDVPTGSYSTNVTPSAEWQRWEYENGAWIKKTYGMTIAADQKIVPDVNAFSSFQSGGSWHMKSGYGLSLTANTSISRYGSSDLPGSGAYVLPQNGNAYFPEFGYELADSKYRTLQLTSTNRLEFETNPYSITALGEHDGRRIHYTPLWYPDGNYTVKTYLYDCWTPAGMISLQDTLNPIVIGSNIYNDWFINHK